MEDIAASIINQLAYEDLKTMDRLRLTIELAQVLTDEFSRDKIESLSGKMQLSDMVRLQDQLNRSIDGLGESKSALQKTYDWIREGKLPELMEAQELDGLKVEGIGRVHLQSDVRASIKAENKAAAYEWLGDNGHGGFGCEACGPRRDGRALPYAGRQPELTRTGSGRIRRIPLHRRGSIDLNLWSPFRNGHRIRDVIT